MLSLDEQSRRLIPCTFEVVAKLPTWLYTLVGIDFSRVDPDFDPYDRLFKALRDARGAR